jgi:hypothetical protein
MWPKTNLRGRFSPSNTALRSVIIPRTRSTPYFGDRSVRKSFARRRPSEPVRDRGRPRSDVNPWAAALPSDLGLRDVKRRFVGTSSQPKEIDAKHLVRT